MKPTRSVRLGHGLLLAGLALITAALWSVPVQAGTVDHFSIQVPSLAEAGGGFPMTITAYDASGQTCTGAGEVPGMVTLTVSSGVAFDTTSYSLTSIAGTEFNGDGTWTGTFYIYRRALNVMITATDGAATGHSNVLNVEVSPVTTYYRYILIMPGMTYTPGENHTNWGVNGTPATSAAGAGIPVTILATDLYGNRLFSGAYANVTANLSLERSDPSATLPSSVALTNGQAFFNLTPTTAYAPPNRQQVHAFGGLPFPGVSGYFTVLSSVLHHFTIGQAGSVQTAGNPFTGGISARDVYNNIVTGFAGPVYVTCPGGDYHTPEQSVIQLGGGTVNGTTWTLASGFVNGQWSGPITVYRAGAVRTLTVSSNPDGSGATGSTSLEIVPNVLAKTLLLAPGLEHRPGSGGGLGNSLGGYAGTPDAQQTGAQFPVTVYATDAWWNRVNSTGAFRIYTQPTSSSLNGQEYAFQDGVKIVQTALNAPDAYRMTADYNLLDVADYTTPYFITARSLDHFRISGPGGVNLPSVVTAGVPFNVSITAYADAFETMIAGTFDGQVNLITTADWEEPYRVISPQTITFSQGVWYGPVTLYRAVNSVNLLCSLGAVGSLSPHTITVYPAARRHMLGIAPGMDFRPGVAPDAYPPGGFSGYVGNPDSQEAGQGFDLRFFLTDDYYNVVTGSAQGGTHPIRISSSDPYPASANGVSLPVTVNLGPAAGYAAGAYQMNDIKLFTVGANGYQTITVEDLSDGSVTPFTLGGNGVPPVNVRHTYLARPGRPAFSLQVPATARTAGESFSATITALDQYGNVMDDRNGAAAFSPAASVSLLAGTGSQSLFPTIVQLPDNGTGEIALTCYKTSQGAGNSITAAYSDADGPHYGSSAVFDVNPGAFSRLIPIVPNMDINGGGRYTAEPPTEFLGYVGSPAPVTAGQVVNLRVYACDAYGNIVSGHADWIGISSTDRFAPVPSPVRLDAVSGYASFSTFSLHTASPASISAHDQDNGTISDGLTPDLTANPAAAYGLVTLAPGQVLVEGSGNSNMASGIGGVVPGGWYSGVTQTEPNGTIANSYSADPEISGAYFPVTIVAVDVFGNRRTDVDGCIELRTNENNSDALPNLFHPLTTALSSGRSWVMAALITRGVLSLYPWYTSNSLMNHGMESRSDVAVINDAQTHYKIWINEVEAPGSAAVQVAPSTFTARVEIRDDTSNKIVRTANTNFIMEVFTNPVTQTPGSGVLNITFGQTSNGIAVIPNLTYSQAETIYIRVREASGNARPTLSDSAFIQVIGPSATPTPTITITPNASTSPAPSLTASSTPTPNPISSSTPTPTSTSTSTFIPTPTPTPTPEVLFQASGNELTAVNNRYLPGRSTHPVLLQFNQKTAGPVTLKIYTSRGTPVITLVDNQDLAAGPHTWEWRAQTATGDLVPSGIYIAHIIAPGVNQYVRVAVIK